MASFFRNLKDRITGDHKIDYDDLSVRNMVPGCIFEYDLRSFEVTETYEYDWGNDHFSREYKIYDGTRNLYLAVDEEDELHLTVSSKVPLRKLGAEVRSFLERKNKPPQTISYEGVDYFRDTESPGYFRNWESNPKKDESWTEMVSWDYYDDTDKKVMFVEQWGDDDFEAAVGIVIPEHAISNILPSPNH